MPGDSPVLLGKPDNKLLDIQQADRKFDYKTMQTSNGFSCKANTYHQIKTNNTDVVDATSNTLDYVRSSINRAADKRASQVLMQKIHNEFNECLHEGGVLKAHLAYR